MIRQIDLEDVTDGKRYGLQDLAKVGCNECKGCSSCCTDMDGSILLDPYDAFLLEKECKRSFSELIGKEVELRVIDGVILPNIRMTTNKNCCSFLNEEGRCSIYDNRPSICRIFPLGRIYENNTFQYILQTKECEFPNKTKMKVKKWIGIENQKAHDQFTISWHYFIRELQELFQSEIEEEIIKNYNLLVLQNFYFTKYEENTSFFIQFEERLLAIKGKLFS